MTSLRLRHSAIMWRWSTARCWPMARPKTCSRRKISTRRLAACCARSTLAPTAKRRGKWRPSHEPRCDLAVVCRASAIRIYAESAAHERGGGAGVRGAVVLPHPQGLVADGRRGIAFGAAGCCAVICAGAAVWGWRVRLRLPVGADDRLRQAADAPEGRRGNGHHLYRAVCGWSGADLAHAQYG